HLMATSSAKSDAATICRALVLGGAVPVMGFVSICEWRLKSRSADALKEDSFMRRLMFFFLTFLAVTDLAAAQVCVGGPSFGSNHVQVGAGLGIQSASPSFGASIGLGSDRVFGETLLGVQNADAASRNADAATGVGKNW